MEVQVFWVTELKPGCIIADGEVLYGDPAEKYGASSKYSINGQRAWISISKTSGLFYWKNEEGVGQVDYLSGDKFYCLSTNTWERYDFAEGMIRKYEGYSESGQ